MRLTYNHQPGRSEDPVTTNRSAKPLEQKNKCRWDAQIKCNSPSHISRHDYSNKHRNTAQGEISFLTKSLIREALTNKPVPRQSHYFARLYYEWHYHPYHYNENKTNAAPALWMEKIWCSVRGEVLFVVQSS